MSDGQCFNSSVGILSVGTSLSRQSLAGGKLMFQFLSRNSVRWDVDGKYLDDEILKFQFLSRNSVRWDERMRYTIRCIREVSIPQSEFCPLGRVWRRGYEQKSLLEFQFLSRNSVRWDSKIPLMSSPISFVSIPQSEFCPLGRSRQSARWL